MRIRFHTLLVIVLPIVNLAGCGDDPVTPSRASLPIMPLAVGNMWIGRSYGLDSAGGPIAARPDTMSIVASETIDGATWYRTSEGRLLANKSDGLYERAHATARPVLRAKHPASIGEVFGDDTLAVFNPDTLDHEIDSLILRRLVIAVGTGLTVTAGTYSVTGYEEQNYRLDGTPIPETHELWTGDESYFAPGVGRVQDRAYFMTSSGKALWHVWELVEARLK